jgi:hypothetical protein
MGDGVVFGAATAAAVMAMTRAPVMKGRMEVVQLIEAASLPLNQSAVQCA